MFLLFLSPAKLVLIAGNTAPLRRSELEYYAMLSKTPVHLYNGDNIQLGTAAGKMFRVGVLTITDPGDSVRIFVPIGSPLCNQLTSNPFSSAHRLSSRGRRLDWSRGTERRTERGGWCMGYSMTSPNAGSVNEHACTAFLATRVLTIESILLGHTLSVRKTKGS
jgi:ribosomal protein L30E